MQWPRVPKTLSRVLRALGALIILLTVALIAFSLSSPPVHLLFPPTAEATRHPPETANVPNYARDEVDTFYTYPEWYIVWSYQAKADFQQKHLPSGYSYFGDIGQFWQAYSRMFAATRRIYPFAAGDHVMLAVIGSSFSVEYALKGAYEGTVGRASEWTSGNAMTAEDEYAAKVAENYAVFVHTRPFYEFSFAHALRGLWSDTTFRTAHLLRTLERRAWLSLDYAVESVYCELIELATHATYGYEDEDTAAWIEFPQPRKGEILASIRAVRLVKDIGRAGAIVEIPRYQEFTTDVRTLLNHGVRFHQIAGNELIVISALGPSGWTAVNSRIQALLKQPVLTDSGRTRTVLLAKVSELDAVLPWLEHEGLTIEHLYDY